MGNTVTCLESSFVASYGVTNTIDSPTEDSTAFSQYMQTANFLIPTPQVLEKIVSGKMGKYFKENCLVDQEFVKDSSMTVAKYTEATAKKLGGSIAIKKFIRFEKGEGIEKRQDDFAAEVASMVN